MPQCYAKALGDCDGDIENEHYFSKALQRMLGHATIIRGSARRKSGERKVAPGTYAYSKMLCERHHDALEGTDAAVTDYCRNLMLIAGGARAHDKPGQVKDVIACIDGRALEKWFLKFICGAIASGDWVGPEIRVRWIRGLFGRIPWPDDWALYVVTGEAVTAKRTITFSPGGRPTTNGLEGVAFDAFGIQSFFTIRAQAGSPPQGWLKRPKGLGARVTRPGDADVLIGLPAGNDVRFEIRWPGS